MIQLKEGTWIQCSDRLPTKKKWYLVDVVFVDERYQTKRAEVQAWLNPGGWNVSGNVLAWYEDPKDIV